MGLLGRQSQDQMGSELRAWAARIEANPTIDEIAAPLERVASAVTQSDSVHDLLRGRWLGHALHPLLTDFPLGSWISASVLDFFGGEQARPSARRLVGFGVLTAVPTAIAGLADWSDTTGGARRAGAVHGAMNGGILVSYAASWVARRRGRHGLGVVLAVAGGSAAWISGYLGGHLSLVTNTGIANRKQQTSDGTTSQEATMTERERDGDPTEQEGQSGSVVHGGKDDPLGGGVADLEESSEVSEGVPDQENRPSENS